MVTNKSFTSIEQSKVLAEILPLESADMHYSLDIDFMEHGSVPTVTEEDDHFELFQSDIPCWSLASLLNVIPYNISFNKEIYCFKLVKCSDHWICCHGSFGSTSTGLFKADNPIDVCYKMILKLHKLKML